MANSKDNIESYATNYFNFNEASGNVTDLKGSAIGTITGATRVTGYEGSALRFNGTSNYVTFNQKVIPVGEKSIRFKFKRNGVPSTNEYFISNINSYAGGNGIAGTVNSEMNFRIGLGNSTANRLFLVGGVVPSVFDGQWHDILFTWDGTTNANAVKLYVDDMNNPLFTDTSLGIEVNEPSLNLTLGRLGTGTNWFTGELDELEIYNKVISGVPDKTLFKDSQGYKAYIPSTNDFRLLGNTITDETYKNLGITDTSVISENNWKTLEGNVDLLTWTDYQPKTEIQYSVETNPFTLSDELGTTFSVIEYTDNPTQDSSIVQAETEPFSVYDHISETPEVLVYTELNDDVKIETTTEPFDIYDEFGNEVEVLHYTDDESVNQANLVLEANYSPIDELQGDVEVVTWTNEENAFRKLEVEGELAPKLIYPTSINTIIGDVANIKVALQNSNGNERFVLTDNNSTWYVWNGSTFIAIPKEDISLRGMTLEELNNSDFSKWTRSKIAVGVFADSSTEITSISYDEAIRNKTSKVNDISLYVLNTTAKIDIQLTGSTVRGTLSDADSTKVQYRVVLNDSYYYPSNGNFTALTPSPVPIEFTLKSSDVKVGDWNKLKVEFKDYFGTTDYWEVEFIGRYSGVMFRTIDGQYYSSDIGEVLRYLDFGSIVSGQTTMIQTVVLKNEFGYSISDVDLSVNTNALPKGVNVEFSRNGINQWSPTLRIADSMAMDEEVRFDVRMRTVITATPTPNGKFDIFVMAKKSE